MESEKQELSRRSFVKWSAAVAGAATTAGLVGCAGAGSGGGGGGGTGPVAERNIGVDLTDGEWKGASCWSGCGGSCVNQVFVKDGVALLQKTDVIGKDDFDNPQQRGCAKGRNLRRLVFGADRLKYPMKRKSWQPGGGENSKGHLRGIDEWERISWDEAYDLIHTEMKRIIDNYGNKAIMHVKITTNRMLNAVGGSSTFWACWSSGGIFYSSQKMIGGGWPWHALTLSDRFEYRKSKLIVLWGHNPAWASQGNPIYNLLAAKEAGAKIIVIDPIYHDTAKMLADEFVPCRPCTDAALLLAVAYEMIQNNWHDQGFLDKYCIGFDADHMPEGADTKENFKDYVLGTYDGKPKTPEWASEICGTPVDTIKSLAKQIATTKPLAFTCSRAPSRTSDGDQFAQTFLTVGWMTGEVAKPGSMVGHVVTSNVGGITGGPRLITAGTSNIPAIPNPVTPYIYYAMNVLDTGEWSTVNLSEIWDAIVDKKYRAGVKGEQPIDIHMISQLGTNNLMNTAPGVNRAIEAHRAVDFVLADGFHMTMQCWYADIILPSSTPWENPHRSVLQKTNKETIMAIEPITEPLFETKRDADRDAELAAKFGIDPNVIIPVPLAQQEWNKLQGAKSLAEDGKTMEPLFTIEADDIPDGVEGSPQQGKVTIKQFYKDKIWRVERKDGDNYGYTALKDFIDDPVANPRDTESGKFEIYCKALAKWVDGAGFNKEPKSPIGKYLVPQEGYEETFSDWENKVKGPYPLQMFSLHCLRTTHSTFDNAPLLREAFPNDLQINPVDANERGLKKGDTVLITSKWGKVLRNVDISERIMPGVVKLDHSTWPEIDEETGIDYGGAVNMLVGPIKSGSGIQAWNSCICQVEKWTGEPLVPDCDRPVRFVEV
jgi:anaerobic dimethyl sulfoxide reductase subunit A